MFRKFMLAVILHLAVPAGAFAQTEWESMSIQACAVGCGSSYEIDPCLVGTWRADGNGFVDWMRASGIPLVLTSASPFILKLGAGHVFGEDPYTFGFEVSAGGVTAIGTGSATEAYGCWSAEDGKINFCYADDTPRINMRVTAGGMTHTSQAPPRSRPIRAFAYECQPGGPGTHLRMLTEVSKRDAPVVLNMTKVGN